MAVMSILDGSNSPVPPTKLCIISVEAVPPLLIVGTVGMVDAEDGEVVRQQPRRGEIVERRGDEAFGQIAPAAEDHHGAGAGLGGPTRSAPRTR